MTAYTRPETKKQFMSRRVRELAAQHKHDPTPVVPLRFDGLDFVVDAQGSVCKREDAQQAEIKILTDGRL